MIDRLKKEKKIEQTYKTRIIALVHRHDSVFQTCLWANGPCRLPALKLQLKEDVTDFGKTYLRKYSDEQKAAIDKELDNLVKAGILKDSLTDICSPVHCVAKKRNKSTGEIEWRLVCAMQKINSKLVTMKHPLRNIPSLIQGLKGTKYMFCTDLYKMYWRMRLDKDSQHLCGIMTHRGVYVWTRCPMGLKNSGSWCDKQMHTLFRHQEGIISWVDDVLVYAPTMELLVKKIMSVL